ncbi:Oidioi.mRNA.OKI2018_I69.chr1.g89.t1.cds [Oikopleura dioica]|uniref:Oidioi.mRNA.OKI2018_I69.chr1.g89.t1.cds n=1 Tax=Oikopleura dioica TaxID=34765 RepID=A0ABN7SIS8_OIKDI|nr:Oidioi.mRNA.OKI2018_I69.chr1.g89.t1.cds [Oikopleura dioica]
MLVSLIFGFCAGEILYIKNYGEKIDLRRFASCHIYDMELTKTITVKLSEDEDVEFLDINDVQVGIGHVPLPIQKPVGYGKHLIQWITGENTSKKISSELEKQLICTKEEDDCFIRVNFSGKNVLKIRGISQSFCQNAFITTSKRPAHDLLKSHQPDFRVENHQQEKEFFSMGLIIGISSSVAVFFILGLLVVIFIRRRQKNLEKEEESAWNAQSSGESRRVEHIYEEIDDSLIGQNPSYHVYDTLEYATTGRAQTNGYDHLQL